MKSFDKALSKKKEKVYHVKPEAAAEHKMFKSLDKSLHKYDYKNK